MRCLGELVSAIVYEVIPSFIIGRGRENDYFMVEIARSNPSPVNLTQSDRNFHVSKNQNAILKKSTVFRDWNGIIRSDYYRLQ